jgi:hypothetical protein
VERERLRAVEDLITTSLAVFEAINDAARAAQALPEGERAAAAPQVIAHYRQWFDGSQQELRAVLSLESAGCAVAGALEFKRALADARVYGYESERLLNSLRKLDAGEGTRFEEAMATASS